MDRIIKFRVWNGERMLYPEYFGSDAYGSLGQITIGWTNQSYIDLGSIRQKPYEAWEGCTLMQFTGLYDSEGKEIWESDIIEIQNESQYTKKEYWYPIYEIKNDGWKFKLKYIKGGLHSDNEFLVRQYSTERVKVLGNIYEHPNLLQ